MKRIEGKVAKILNERELVLNVGLRTGVEIGMKFNILYESGLEILDPDDPEINLGSLEWPKTQVKIVDVQQSFSVGRTFRTVKIPAKGSSIGKSIISYADLFHYEPSREEMETLRSGSGYAAQEINDEDSVVKIGDIAVQAFDRDLTDIELD